MDITMANKNMTMITGNLTFLHSVLNKRNTSASPFDGLGVLYWLRSRRAIAQKQECALREQNAFHSLKAHVHAQSHGIRTPNTT